MSTINTSTLLTRLQTLLATDYTATSTEVSDILSTSLSIQTLNENSIIVVDDVDSLPDLTFYTLPSGMVYFVNNIGVFAISANGRWITLDGRLLRQGGLISLAWAWGCNGQGRLGGDTTTDRSSPVSVVGGFTDWCQVSAGFYHSLALRTNGTAWTWGCSVKGQLGDGTTISRSSPVSVVGGFTDWCQVSAGGSHSLALRTNGTAWAWGNNCRGRLGDNTTTDRSSPVSVVGGFTDWCQVSAGFYHSLALRTNGTAWAWGYNGCGRIGDGAAGNVARSSPVSVVGGFTDWCQVSAGVVHSLAVRSNGTAWAWGYNGSGRLGDNTATDRSSPVSVVGGFTDWCRVSAGAQHSLALRSNGTAWAWGSNDVGRIGDGTTTTRSSPVSIIGGFTDWCQISTVSIHNLALRTNGTAWVWGCNGQGRLGDNTTTARSSPVSVVGGFTDWCQISAGDAHSLGVRVRC